MTNDADANERIRSLANEILAVLGEKPIPAAKAEAPKTDKKKVTLEQVRAALTTLSSTKGAKTVKDLLAQYEVAKLSEIAERDYAQLLADAEAWGNE